MCLGVQAKAQAATKGTNLVDLESERAKEVEPKAGSLELLGHEDHPGTTASSGAASQGYQHCLACNSCDAPCIPQVPATQRHLQG